MTSSSADFLIVSDDDAVLSTLRTVLSRRGGQTLESREGPEAIARMNEARFAVVVIDLDLPGYTGLQLLEWIRAQPFAPEVITLSSRVDARTLKMGAFDNLTKPLDNAERLDHALRQASENHALMLRLQMFQEAGINPVEGRGIIGKSPKMQAVFEMIRNVAPSASTVLIQGESGTGKELVAQAIHRNSPRHDKPFVVINCAAMPETLMEAELFGYAKGSFTGASHDKKGLFEEASGGSVFLDEIGDVPLSIQVKLLRVLQEGEIRRLGENVSRQTDVRIIAATNRDLAQMIRDGGFREDLYYRLNVIQVWLPPLRDRPEDIPLLAYHFLRKMSEKTGREVRRLSVDVLQALEAYSWPGNIRELENVMERAVVLSGSDTILAKNLPPKILSASFYNIPADQPSEADLDYKEAKKRALNIFNRSYIMNLLQKTGGNLSAAAEKAGMDRSNFKKIIRKYRIEV